MLKSLIRQNRSYRRFHQQIPISYEQLYEWVDLARLSASSANRQPLKFALSADPERNSRIFPCLRWAGYLSDWGGPAEGERPVAYIVILGDKRISANTGVDPGIAAQSILLGAVEAGFGGCILGAIDRDTLRSELSLPEHFDILLVLALGRPSEQVVIEAVSEDGDIRYWRDVNGVHHVPKRALDTLIII
ncbi:MAG: nitroreductase A [Chloroflexi bacterium ADurb.Bin360]|nr:MAG: nitroreductase A [Chloroflexi bacterium ADurb.Bin360]